MRYTVGAGWLAGFDWSGERATRHSVSRGHTVRTPLALLPCLPVSLARLSSLYLPTYLAAYLLLTQPPHHTTQHAACVLALVYNRDRANYPLRTLWLPEVCVFVYSSQKTCVVAASNSCVALASLCRTFETHPHTTSSLSQSGSTSLPWTRAVSGCEVSCECCSDLELLVQQ